MGGDREKWEGRREGRLPSGYKINKLINVEKSHFMYLNKWSVLSMLHVWL